MAKDDPYPQGRPRKCGSFLGGRLLLPGLRRSLANFKPDLSKYRVILSNYNGEGWLEPTQRALEDYVRNGGGFVAVHAADNAFPKWAEYNRMVAVGGWGGRNDQSGPMLRWRDGQVVKDPHGGGGTHGRFFAFVVETRDANHPITKGLPEKWLHASEGSYATLCGPALDVTVLARPSRTFRGGWSRC